MNDITPPGADSGSIAFNPLDPAFIADPYPFYHRLRETAPVFKTPLGFWLLSRYDDIAFALRDKRFGKDFSGNIQRRYGADRMAEPAIANLSHTASPTCARASRRSSTSSSTASPARARWT